MLSYFDPDNDGVVRLQELHSALRKLDLGLSRSQLNQLVLSLGYTLGDEEVEPVEIIRGLLAAVAPATKKGSLSYSGEMPLAKGESATPISGATTKRNTSPGVGDGDSSYTLARRASAVLDMKVKRLRDLIMRHKADVTRSFGADGIKELFQKAGTHRDAPRTQGASHTRSATALTSRSSPLNADRGDVGFLTYDDCDVLIKQLQAACEVELFSQAEIAEVVRHMDIERDGHITFLEFVHAFGIGDNDDARDDDEVDGIDGAGSLVCLEMMQQICSSLFERSHALGKAFHYVDTSGRGYLPPDEFEKAVELVLTSDESHHCPGGGELTSSQVKHLVYSLRGSTLVDERGHIDFAAFIQSFKVVDVIEDERLSAERGLFPIEGSTASNVDNASLPTLG